MEKGKNESSKQGRPDRRLNEYLSEMDKFLAFNENAIITPEPEFIRVQAICQNFPHYRERCTFLFIFKRPDSIGPVGGLYISPELFEQLACLAYARNMGFKTMVILDPMPKADKDKLSYFIAPNATEGIWS